MNTQTRKVTSRGRVVTNPKRFTPSSLSPPQPTNQPLKALNVIRHVQPGKRPMGTNRVRSRLSSIENQMNIDDDDDSDEADDDQPPKKIPRTISRSQFDELEDNEGNEEFEGDYIESSQESMTNDSCQSDEEETTAIENNTASRINYESTPVNSGHNLYKLIGKDISDFSAKLNYLLDTHMERLEKRLNRLAASCLSIKTTSIEQFRSSSNEEFESAVDHEGFNLLQIYAKDYGEYARQVLRVLYKPDELTSSILPSSCNHFSRKQLDNERFRKFHRAVRNKYRISWSAYDEFFNVCLRRKLVNFLCYERKRFNKKQKIYEQEQQILNNNDGNTNPTPPNDNNE
ncbi:unnamed protein product [Rotaria socialis]|uniref:Uncharacterized protein n=1 Tax=Rotaria socialis TaxID=392032 RepID=A0A820TZ98_9BILA|nr:unnamed protein product [Rotaria socialis]